MTDEALTIRRFVSPIEQEYTIVSPKTKMHKLADIFADNPEHAVLVFDSKRDKFHGILYLYTFLQHYASNPKNIHMHNVKKYANTNIVSINWNKTVPEAMAEIKKLQPQGVLLHNDENEFVGFLANNLLLNHVGLDGGSEE